MTRKIRAYLELVRLPNIFTALADILAGFLYAGGGLDQWQALLKLGGASACLYAGGVALNDFRDRELDGRRRPNRPIPSGRITPGEASVTATALLVAGVVLAAWASPRSGVLAAILVGSIVLYNSLMKSTALGPALMGFCRAMNLTLAMSVTAGDLWGVQSLMPAGLMWLYGCSVTFFARTETEISSGARLWLGTGGVCAATSGLAVLRWTIPDVHIEYLGLAAALVVVLGHRGIRAARRRDPNSVQQAVGTFIVALIAFDACIALAAQGWIAALAVACMFVPTVALARGFQMT